MFNNQLVGMETKVYVSEQNEGWKEIQVPDKFKRYSYDALISVLHNFLDLSRFKGILVTENPDFRVYSER